MQCIVIKSSYKMQVISDYISYLISQEKASGMSRHKLLNDCTYSFIGSCGLDNCRSGIFANVMFERLC